MTYDAFISCSSADIDTIDIIVNKLRNDYNLSCWCYNGAMTGGVNFREEITTIINESAVFVIMTSQHSILSKDVFQETSVAFEKDKPIIPFRLDDSRDSPGFEYFLSGRQNIDGYVPTLDDRIYDLAVAISRFCGKHVRPGVYLASALKDLSTGKSIKIGSYMRTLGEAPRTDIEWLVIDEDEESFLLLAKEIVDVRYYNNGNGKQPTTWAECSLRQWLNNVFYQNVFLDSEKKLIKATRLSNPDNPQHTTEGGSETEDRLFILSPEELEKYFSVPEGRTAEFSAYCLNQLFAQGEGEPIRKGKYWLRCPGYYRYRAAIVNETGKIDLDGYSADHNEIGVRPAMRLYKTSD